MATSSCFHVTQVEEIKRIVGEGLSEREIVGPDGLPVSVGRTVLLSTDVGAAAANTAALQAALDAGGCICPVGAGVCWINDTLLYGDDTTILDSPGLTIEMVAGVNKSMLRPRAHSEYVAGGAAVTATWSAGTSVSIAWAGHGKSVGQAVFLWGVTPLIYCGTFLVESVTDANNFKIRLPRTPSAVPSGSMRAIKAVQRFRLDCPNITWDYNYPNNNNNTWDAHALGMYFAEDCHFKTRVANVAKYGLCTQATLNCTIDIESPYTPSDGVKVYGPARNTFILGVRGAFGDDGCSMHTAEWSAPYPQLMPHQVGGELYNCWGKDINAYSLISLATIYMADGIYVDQVGYDNVAGLGTVYAVRVQGQSTSAAAGTIRLKNVVGQGGTDTAIYVGGSTVDRLEVDDWKINPLATSTAPLFTQQTGSVINSLVFNRPDLFSTGWQSSNATPPITCNGTTKSIEINSPEFKSSLVYTAGILNLGAGSHPHITIRGGYCNASAAAVVVSPGLSVAPIINFVGHNFDAGSGSTLVNASGNCTITLTGGNRVNANQGIYRNNQTVSVTLKGDGTATLAGTTGSAGGTGIPWSTGSGTLTATVYDWGLPVDVGATGLSKTVSGQYCYNVGSARGTLTQNRLVTCNGANWVQVDTPANVY